MDVRRGVLEANDLGGGVWAIRRCSGESMHPSPWENLLQVGEMETGAAGMEPRQEFL